LFDRTKTDLVGKALLWTLERGLGTDWSEELKEAWQACYKMLSDTMINAVSEAPAV
jgi:hemoglobin-like flavoprotein